MRASASANGAACRHAPAGGARRARPQPPRRPQRLACHASVVWRQLEGTKAWVAHPRAARVKGIVHFLGGAFAGAAPQLLYNGFVELLADAGYTTVATPYAVTFRHDLCAKAARAAFLRSVEELRAAGRGYLAPPRAPAFGVGHSNGALLHLLISSLEPWAYQGNVIISYNNLQVSDAIPIPGLLEGLQPTVQAARGAGAPPAPGAGEGAAAGAPPQPSSGQVLAAAAAALPGFLLPADQQLVAGAAPALDQLASIVNEVGDGLTDFRPSPEESRAIVAAGYSCPATLLVQFEEDSFDETPEMEGILSRRIEELLLLQGERPAGAEGGTGGGGGGSNGGGGWGGGSAWSSIDEDVDVSRVLQELAALQPPGPPAGGGAAPALQRVLMPGSHVTPCGGGAARREPGLVLTPADVADVLAAAAPRPGGAAELQGLAEQVLGWLEAQRLQRPAPAGPAAAVAAAAAAAASGATGAVAAAAGQQQ